jgi:dTDP-4-dehydrorhamnose 3,5-epimerase-like enzyme
MAKIIKLKTNKTKKGHLTSLDRELPFLAKRVYFLHDIKQIRGKHAHKKNIQIIICLKGTCKIKIIDIRKNKVKKYKIFILNKINKALYLNPWDWHEITNYSKNTLIAVIASEKYNIDDYVE